VISSLHVSRQNSYAFCPIDVRISCLQSSPLLSEDRSSIWWTVQIADLFHTWIPRSPSPFLTITASCSLISILIYAWLIYSLFHHPFFIRSVSQNYEKILSFVTSIRTHRTTLLPVNKFSWNLNWGLFENLSKKNSRFIRIWQELRVLYINTCVHLW